MSDAVQRRDFLKGLTGGVVAGAMASAKGAESAGSGAPGVGSLKDVPKRKLGKLDFEVAPLSFGSAPMGHAFYRAEPFEEVLNAALDAGVNYIDTARLYDIAEERLRPVLAKRRQEVFLVTKAWSRTKDDALRSLEKSLTLMGVDHVDLCHMHNVGQYTRQEALGKEGLLEGLIEARERGWTKHIGCTGHLMPATVVPVLETGEIDVCMFAMNFVDRHTYNFEETVLPTARKRNVGIVAMKVYGGVTGGWDGYRKRRPGRLVADEHRQDAFDYALSVEGLATCVVGMKTLGELRLAIEAVRNHKPLTGRRREAVLAKGKRIAAEWGDHFGPVA